MSKYAAPSPGSPYEGVHPEAGVRISEGENLEVDPPRRLVQSFTALWSDEVQSEGPSRARRGAAGRAAPLG